jgi:hypothetical protein
MYAGYGDIKNETVGISFGDPTIISIESSIDFEYYEPHSDDQKTYQWEATLNLSEWKIDTSDFEWSNEGNLAIDNVEINFSEKIIIIQS